MFSISPPPPPLPIENPVYATDRTYVQNYSRFFAHCYYRKCTVQEYQVGFDLQYFFIRDTGAPSPPRSSAVW